MAVTLFKSSDNFNMAGFNKKITEADNTYVAKTGDSMTGALSMGNNKITDVMSPVNDGDAVNKGYVDGNSLNIFSLTISSLIASNPVQSDSICGFYFSVGNEGNVTIDLSNYFIKINCVLPICSSAVSYSSSIVDETKINISSSSAFNRYYVIVMGNKKS